MKSKLIIVLLVTLTNCTNQNNNTMEEIEKKNREMVQTYFKHFNNHDWESMANMYTNPAMFKDPALGTETVQQTHEDIIAKYSELNVIFSDIKDEVVQVYTSGKDHVIVECISTGTAPDGTAFMLPICTIFKIKDNKITHDFTYYDNFEE